MEKKNLKQIFTIENLLYFFLILCPILDVSSFLFRNKFQTNFSISTFIRPIIPIVAIIYIFFKDNIKKKLTLAGLIYAIYALIHLILYKKIATSCAYGNVIREAQYIVNYTFMIMNLFIYLYIFVFREKDKNIKNNNIYKLRKVLLITFTIYIALMYIAIITGTSSYTYGEDKMGYKGWFESGNSVGAIMILLIFAVIPFIEKENDKRIRIWSLIDIVLSGIYLMLFLGTRVGLFGFILVVLIYIVFKVICNLFNSKKINRKAIEFGICSFTIILVLVGIFGSTTLSRRKLLKEREATIYDSNIGESAHVTGDILELVNKIEKHEVPESYMSYEMQRSIIDLYNYNNAHHVPYTSMRTIQLVYHTELVKNQRDLILMLFGNGYMSHITELIFEMEVPAFLYNFGILGFIMYFIPFLTISVYAFYNIIKNYKKVDSLTVMSTLALCFAIGISFFAGYTFFNSSTMMIIIALCIFATNNINSNKSKDKENNIVER